MSSYLREACWFFISVQCVHFCRKNTKNYQLSCYFTRSTLFNFKKNKDIKNVFGHKKYNVAWFLQNMFDNAITYGWKLLMLCKAEYVLVHICESFLISSFVKNARKEKVGKILENTATSQMDVVIHGLYRRRAFQKCRAKANKW